MPGTTPEAVVGILRGFDFNVTADCVRVSEPIESPEIKAAVL